MDGKCIQFALTFFERHFFYDGDGGQSKRKTRDALYRDHKTKTLVCECKKECLEKNKTEQSAALKEKFNDYWQVGLQEIL